MLSARSGAREENRTPDLLITSELLYRLSYPGVPRTEVREVSSIQADGRTPEARSLRCCGADRPHKPPRARRPGDGRQPVVRQGGSRGGAPDRPGAEPGQQVPLEAHMSADRWAELGLKEGDKLLVLPRKARVFLQTSAQGVERRFGDALRVNPEKLAQL